MPSGIVSRPVIGPNPALFRTKKHSNTTRAHADTLGHSQASERGSDKENRAYTDAGVSKFESNVSYLDDMSKKRSGNKPGRGSEGKLRDGVWDSSNNRHGHKPNKIGELPTKRQKAPRLPTRLDTGTEESVKDVFAFTEPNEPNKRIQKEKWIKPQSKKIPQVRSSMDQRQRIKQTKEREKQAYIEQGADALKRIREQRGKKVLGVAARRQMQADEEIRAAKQIKKDNYQSSILEYNQKSKTQAKTRREHVNNFNSSVKSAKTKRGAPLLTSSKREKNRAATDSDGASSDDDFDSDRRSSTGYASGAPSSETRDRSRSVSGEGNRSDNQPARRRNSLRSADSPTSESETKSKKNGTTACSTGTMRDIFNHRQNPSRRGEHARKEPSSKSRTRTSGCALDNSDDASDAGGEILELPKDSGRGNIERGMDSPSREKRNASDKKEPGEKYEDADGVFDPMDPGGGSSSIEQIGELKPHKKRPRKDFPGSGEVTSEVSLDDTKHDNDKEGVNDENGDGDVREVVVQPKSGKNKVQKFPDLSDSASAMDRDGVAGEKEVDIQVKSRKKKSQKKLPAMPDSPLVASGMASDVEVDGKNVKDDHESSDANEKEEDVQVKSWRRKAQKRLPDMPENELIASKEASDIEGDCGKNTDEYVGSDAEEKEDVLQPKERKRKAQKWLPEMPENELIASKEASDIVGDCGKNTDEHVDSDAEDKEDVIQPKERKRKAQKWLPEMPGSETKLNESADDVSNQEKTTTTRSTRAVRRSTTETIPETPGSGPLSSSKLSGRLSPSGGSVGTRSSGRRGSTTTSMPTKTIDFKSGVLSRIRSRRNVETSDPEEEKPKGMTSRARKRTGLKFTGSGAVSVAGTDVVEATNDTPVVDEDPGPRKRLKRVSGKMTTLPESLDAPAENDEDNALLKIPKKKQRNGNKTAKPISGELSDLGDMDSDEDKPIWNKSTNSKPQAGAQGKGKVLRQTTLFGTKAVETKMPGRKGKATTRAAKATATVTHVSDVDSDTDSDADHNGKRPKRKKARAGSAASASQSVKKTSTGTNKGGMDKAGKSKTAVSARRSARNIRSSLAKEKSGVEKLLAANPGTGRKGIKTIADLDEKVMVDMDKDDKAADTSTGVMNTSTSAYAKGKKNQLSHSDSEQGHSDDDEGLSDIDDTEFNELYHEHTDTSRINNTHEQASDSDGLSDVDEDDDEDEEWQKILEQMKGYRSELKDIKNGKQDSKRHSMFIGAIRERNQLKFMTAQAHLNTKHYGWVTKTLVEWFAPQRLSNSDNYMPLLSYAMDVLLPEVIIRLVRDKNECTYEEAESIMLK